MKKLLFLFLLLFVADVFAQTADWDKIQTADGEFSLKLPAGCYSHFHSPDGFVVRQQFQAPNSFSIKKSVQSYHLKEMRLISCFSDRTLMNVEIYENDQPRQAVKALTDSLKIDGKEISLGDDFYGIEQTINQKDSVFLQFFVAGKKHIYVITAATRGLPNETTKTFIESLKFLSAERRRSADQSEKAISISSLKSVEPELIDETGAPDKSNPPIVPAKEAKNASTLKGIIILSKPNPSYTQAARKNKISGNVRLRLNFGADGRINQFRVMQSLPDGLLREAVIAALRIKFLPAEQSGKPRPNNKLVEYNFKTY